MTRLTRTAAALAVALVAAGGLSGCADQKVGSAAVVDGSRITTDELQQATQDYLAVVPGADPADVQLQILQRMILSEVIDQAAAAADVHTSVGQVAKQRDQVLKSIGGRKGLIQALSSRQQTVLPPSGIDRWVRDQILYTKIARTLANGADPSSTAVQNATSQTLSKTARGMDIEVSPRYGRWSPRTGIEPLVSGGLSQTADQLASP